MDAKETTLAIIANALVNTVEISAIRKEYPNGDSCYTLTNPLLDFIIEIWEHSEEVEPFAMYRITSDDWKSSHSIYFNHDNAEEVVTYCDKIFS